MPRRSPTTRPSRSRTNCRPASNKSSSTASKFCATASTRARCPGASCEGRGGRVGRVSSSTDDMGAHASRFLRRNELLLALVLACFVAVAIWWIRPQQQAIDARPAPTSSPAIEPAQQPGAQEESAPVAVEQPASTAPAHVAIARDPGPAPTPAEKPDLNALDKITIRVIDDRQQPVIDAEVTIHGMRREGDSGGWYGYRGESPTGKTDAHGQVELNHWRWVTLDGRVRGIDVTVVHPEFVPFRDSSFVLGPGEHLITLQRGATVVVSGWLASHPGLIADLKIEVDRDARLPSDAWTREPDGRLSTTRLAPGKHLIWLEHESAALGPCLSAIEDFELGAHEWKELAIELHAAETLDGALDPRVPRPI